MFDLQTDFFRPLWIRVAVVAVCLLWSIFEFSGQSVLWGALFAGLGVVSFHQFFLTDWPDKSNDTDKAALSKDSNDSEDQV